MQILHPFAGSVADYLTQLDDPDRYRPHQCPQCQAKQPLAAHGFYTPHHRRFRFRRMDPRAPLSVRVLPAYRVAAAGIRLAVSTFQHPRDRTVSDGAAPSSVRLSRKRSHQRRPINGASHGSAVFALRPNLFRPRCPRSPIRRPRWTSLLVPSPCFNAAGWIPAHRFLFAALRQHLLGWSRCLIPDGRRVTIPPAAAPA